MLNNPRHVPRIQFRAHLRVVHRGVVDAAQRFIVSDKVAVVWLIGADQARSPVPRSCPSRAHGPHWNAMRCANIWLDFGSCGSKRFQLVSAIEKTLPVRRRIHNQTMRVFQRAAGARADPGVSALVRSAAPRRVASTVEGKCRRAGAWRSISVGFAATARSRSLATTAIGASSPATNIQPEPTTSRQSWGRVSSPCPVRPRPASTCLSHCRRRRSRDLADNWYVRASMAYALANCGSRSTARRNSSVRADSGSRIYPAREQIHAAQVGAVGLRRRLSENRIECDGASTLPGKAASGAPVPPPLHAQWNPGCRAHHRTCGRRFQPRGSRHPSCA